MNFPSSLSIVTVCSNFLAYLYKMRSGSGAIRPSSTAIPLPDVTMAQPTQFDNGQTGQVIDNLLQLSPYTSTSKKIQILWQNILPSYFPLSKGYHIETCNWNHFPFHISTSCIRLLDVYTHERCGPNQFQIDVPKLHLRVICASSDMGNLDCMNLFNMMGPREKIPYDPPCCIITREDSEGSVLAKFTAWESCFDAGVQQTYMRAHLLDCVADLKTRDGILRVDNMLKSYGRDFSFGPHHALMNQTREVDTPRQRINAVLPLISKRQQPVTGDSVTASQKAEITEEELSQAGGLINVQFAELVDTEREKSEAESHKGHQSLGQEMRGGVLSPEGRKQKKKRNWRGGKRGRRNAGPSSKTQG